MKILAFQGSPRPDGNTQAVLEMVLKSAEQAGAEVEIVQISQLGDISGCRECNVCQATADEPGCAIDDDLSPWVGAITKSDVIVWATPVFCWSPSWLAKIGMDRIYCLFKFQEDGEIATLIEGRKMAAVITAGGGPDDGADLVQETCKRLTLFSKCTWLGALVEANVENPATIRADQELTERAQAFGRQLAG